MDKIKQFNFSCYPELMEIVEKATTKTDTKIKNRKSKSKYIRLALYEKLTKDGYDVKEFQDIENQND